MERWPRNVTARRSLLRRDVTAWTTIIINVFRHCYVVTARRPQGGCHGVSLRRIVANEISRFELCIIRTDAAGGALGDPRLSQAFRTVPNLEVCSWFKSASFEPT